LKIDFEDAKTVRLYWDNEKPTHLESEWNEGCARAMEMFGLPGDRFRTAPAKDWIYFYFNNERDALMFVMSVA
jgi:hypothetical protein